MPLTLITDDGKARTAAADWKRQYFDGVKWSKICDGDSKQVHTKLVALGSEPNPRDVARIIGNDSWSSAGICSNCQTTHSRLMECGQQPDYDSNAARLCASCLREALSLIEGAGA